MDISEKIMIPTPVTAKKISMETLNAKLSGPVFACSGNDNGVSYLFFADVHESLANECLPCKSLNDDLTDNNPPGSENCWHITRLLSDIFSKDGVIADMFLEIPFIGKSAPRPSKREIKSSISRVGEINKLHYLFFDCFDKKQCKFKNVRFHYVNNRHRYTIGSEGELLYKHNTLEKVGLIPLINKSLEIINYISKTKIIYHELKEHIELTNQILTEFFSNNIGFKLLKLILTSDNYSKDVSSLLDSLLGKIPNEEEIMSDIIFSNLLVDREGKNMHRVRAQLYALSQEGQEEVVSKITKFILDKYSETIRDDELMQKWNNFMTLYKKLIKGVIVNDNEIIKTSSEVKNIVGFFDYRNSYIMDSYILGRMFRTFPETQHKISNKRTVYAGVNHIITLTEFFEKEMNVSFNKYGSSRSVSTDSNKINRCIDIDINKFL